MTAVTIGCPLQGCTNTTSEVGRPCDECLALFGGAIRQSDRALDLEQYQAKVEQSDRAVARIIAERTGQPYRKANQECWLCTERRTCTKTPSGWECDDCKEIS